jgi:hypothetical protein
MSVAYANATWWAMQLARDVETCCALLDGDPVEPARLDAAWLQLAAKFELIRLDFHAIDLFHRRAELCALLREAA